MEEGQPWEGQLDKARQSKEETPGKVIFREEEDGIIGSRWASASLGFQQGHQEGGTGKTSLVSSLGLKRPQLPVKASRLSKAYPAGPLFLPSFPLLRTVPHLFSKVT